MLSNIYFHPATRRVIILTNRTALSISPSPKTNATPSINYSTAKSVSPNDLIEAKRLVQKTSSSLPTDKSSTTDSPTKLSGTFVLSGIPVSQTAPPLATEQKQSIKSKSEQQSERTQSSGFSALLRNIRSRLTFFPSKRNRPSAVGVATTREHFIPLTRPSLIRLLASDSQLLNSDEDRQIFHRLCEAFDSAVVQRYHPILNELKSLFSPLNPDSEISDQRKQLSERDRLDNEYWLLQKINDLLHRSNFTELPRNILLEKFIKQESRSSSSSDITVKINGHDYDVLKFWILGHEQVPYQELSKWKRLFGKSTSTKSTDYFKRIIVAVRLKGHNRLYLKAFRDIPLQSLPQLLPMGKLQIGQYEQRLLWLTFFVATSTAVTHLITTMANFQIPGLVIGGTSLTILSALWSYRSSYKSKINYLSNMNRLLFYKNIASNKQLLAMIIDRAEDELSKEILITYLITLWRQKQNFDLTTEILELEVENWIRTKTNAEINFKCDQSIAFLRKLGIVLPGDTSKPDCLRVIPMKQVVGILPKISRTLSEKNEEWDLIEGYDKKNFEVDWKMVLNEEKTLEKSGRWH